VIDRPASNLTWAVGDPIGFSGHATDIVNQPLQLTAPNQKLRGKTYAFVSWSYGGVQSPIIRPRPRPPTYTATYQRDGR
jgi:hypothetical protein